MPDSTGVLDYANTGRTIQHALVDHAKRFPDKEVRPKHILWNALRISNADSVSVPTQGVVKVEFIHADPVVRQGFDLKIDDGWIELAAGERVPVLRTWRDERYEDIVEYLFFSRNGLLWTWNVYEMTYLSGEKTEEKWTENAGLWVEILSKAERVYHCSHGMASPPDFNSLVFKLSVRPTEVEEAGDQTRSRNRPRTMPRRGRP